MSEAPASAATRPLAVEGELTIYRAAELKPQLLALPPGEGAVGVDLGQVTDIDTAGVQLLLLAHREARAVSRPWRLVAASAAVQEALTLLGLQALLPADAEGVGA